MIQVKPFLFIIIAATMLTACSTFNSINPFSQPQSEDYNALTYGDQHPGFSARTPVETSSKDSSAAASNEQIDRRTASMSETGENDALDPTEDRVRGQIEVSRGLSVSRYTRGDRATRSDFYDQAPNDGSLWSNDSDGNYFYTKNKMRSMGDIISVKLEDSMVKHIAEEVKKNLTPPEQEVEMALYLKNNAAAKDDKDVQAYRAVASSDLNNSAAVDVKDKMEKAVRWSQIDLTKSIGLTPSEEVRAEIIDRYQNGNYKIRAVKRVLYRGSSKLISVVAVAPQSDFDDKDVINSGKLYEYKIRVAR